MTDLPIHLFSPSTAEKILALILKEHEDQLDTVNLDDPKNFSAYKTSIMADTITQLLLTYLALHGLTPGIAPILSAYHDNYGTIAGEKTPFVGRDK